MGIKSNNLLETTNVNFSVELPLGIRWKKMAYRSNDWLFSLLSLYVNTDEHQPEFLSQRVKIKILLISIFYK